MKPVHGRRGHLDGDVAEVDNAAGRTRRRNSRFKEVIVGHGVLLKEDLDAAGLALQKLLRTLKVSGFVTDTFLTGKVWLIFEAAGLFGTFRLKTMLNDHHFQ